MFRVLARIFLFLLVLLLVIFGIAAVIAVNLPLETYRSQISQHLSKALGKNVRLDGPLSLSLIPKISLSAQNFSIEGPKNQEAPLLSSDAFSLNVALLPLIKRNVKIKAITIKSPKIAYTLSNEQATPLPATSPPGNTSKASPLNETSKNNGFSLQQLQIDKLQIIDAELHLIDEIKGESYTIKNGTLNAQLDNKENKLIVKGNAVFNATTKSLTINEQALNFSLESLEVGKLLALTPARIALLLEAEGLARLEYQGYFFPEAKLSGKVNLNSQNFTPVTNLLGIELDPKLLGSGSFSGNIQMKNPEDIRVEDVKLTYASEAATLDFTGALFWVENQPYAEGELRGAIMDLTPFIAFSADFPQTLATNLNGNATLEAELALVRNDLSVPYLNLSTQTNHGNLSYEGALSWIAAEPQATGNLRFDVQDLAPLIRLGGEGTISLKDVEGQLSGSAELITQKGRLTATKLSATLNSNIAKASLEGTGWYDTKSNAKGNAGITISAEFPSTSALLAPLSTGNTSMTLPESAAILTSKIQLDYNQNLTLRFSDTQLSMAGDLYEAKLEGQGSVNTAGVNFNADMRFNSQALRNFSQSFDLALPGEPERFQSLTATGKLAVKDKLLSLRDGMLTLDGNAPVKADLDLELNDKPKLAAIIDAPALDLDPYFKNTNAPTPGTKEATAPIAKPKGQTWSQDPIDMSALKALDADITLSTKGLKAYGIALGQSKLQAQLIEGRLQADISELQAYEGAGTARIVLNARQKTPSIAIKTDLNQINILPFLKDIADFNKLEGRGALNLDLLTYGPHQAAIIGNLQGKGSLVLQNGLVHGFDIPQSIEGFKAGNPNPKIGDGYKTAFNTLNGSFDIKNGIVTTGGVTLSSSALELYSQGRVNLGAQTLNYRLEPRVSGVYAIGRGQDKRWQDIVLPILIKGSWYSPKFTVDFSRYGEALKQQALQEAEAAAKRLADKAAQKAEAEAKRLAEEAAKKAEAFARDKVKDLTIDDLNLDNLKLDNLLGDLF